MAIYPSKLLVFLFGFAIGVFLAFIMIVSNINHNNQINKLKSTRQITNYFDIEDVSYSQWLTKIGFSKVPVNFDYYSYSGNKSLKTLLELEIFKSRVNVLCIMFVKNVNNAYAALNTWIKRCNNYKFYGLKPEKYLEVTVLRPKNSWHYLCDVIRHIETYCNNYMWVLFVPDDIYAIPENLRHYVFGKNYNDYHYFGQNAIFWNEQFNLAQAGYVLSKGSVTALLKKFNSSESCKVSGRYWKNEDYYLGKHLSQLGIVPADTRDMFGRGRFHSFTPAQLMAPGDEQLFSKYWKTSVHSVVQGKNCCSPRSITFQGTNRDHIYFYHYLLYKLQPHTKTGRLGNTKSNSYDFSEKVWQTFVKDELGPHVNLSAITPKKYYQLWDDKIDSPSNFNKKLKALFLGEVN